MLWLAVAVLLTGWGALAGRHPVRDLAPGTTETTVFPRRPNGSVISLWLRWDAPVGSAGWAVIEARQAWSTSAEMSWRRRVHPGWNHLVWPDLWTLPADEPVRLRLADGAGAAWRLAAPRADAAYGLHHLTPLRGVLAALALAALLAVARGARRAPRCPWRWGIAVAGVAGLALWLRVHTLTLQSLWFDEVLTAIGAQNLAWVLYTPQIFGHPPLQYLVGWAVGGSAADEWWLRLPSLVAGVATVVALAGLGRRLLGPATGLMAALALSLSPFHVEISQLARPYALFLLLTVLSVGALMRALDRQRARDWLWFSALLALSLYTHYLALPVFLLEAVTASVVLARRRWHGSVSAALSFAGAAVLLLPWIPVLRRLGSAQIGQGELPALYLHGLLTRVFIPQFLGPGMGTVVGLGLVACALWSLRRRPDLVLVTALWVALPPLVLWVAQPAHFIAGRHLAFLLPIVMLLLGHGIATVAEAGARTVRRLGGAERSHQRLGAALAAALVVIAWGTPTAGGLRHYYHGRAGADWRTVASLLDRMIPENDRVVATVGAVYPLRHYWSLRVEELASAGFPGAPRLDGRRCWVVTHAGRDRPPELTAWLDAHAVRVGEVPASWSLPGLEIHRLRPRGRAWPEG
jgi:mannosyltransferase